MITRRNCVWLVSVAMLLIVGCHQPLYREQLKRRDTLRRKIDQFMHVLNERGQFNGGALVGDADGILYEAAYGQANRAKSKAFTTDTQSCLASLSKPFTALSP